MPIEVGLDAIEPERVARAVERWGEQFLSKVFTPAERELCRGRVLSLAGRFAAKEAVAKALGTGMGAIAWRDIEVLADDRRRPTVNLHGAAARLAAARGLSNWSISLTHLRGIALAAVVATSEPATVPPPSPGP